MSVSKPGNGEDRSKSIERKGLDIQVQHECKTRVKCHGNRKSPNPVKSSQELFIADFKSLYGFYETVMFDLYLPLFTDLLHCTALWLTNPRDSVQLFSRTSFS
jgi:hypothetical protein